jgi:hypothetical protein
VFSALCARKSHFKSICNNSVSTAHDRLQRAQASGDDAVAASAESIIAQLVAAAATSTLGSDMSDIKELTPEWYSLPDFLVNDNDVGSASASALVTFIYVICALHAQISRSICNLAHYSSTWALRSAESASVT